MTLLILSFMAGVLTVAAPCILPLLPVIVGGSLVESQRGANQAWRPLVITTSLAVSVIIFSLLIKASTILLGVPQLVWQIASGVIVILLGLNYIFPKFWETLSNKTNWFSSSNMALGKAYQKSGVWGAVLIGLALGPVFSSCSPTYALIVATILPVSFDQGLLYLAAYAIGMSAVLLLIAYIGQTFIGKLRWLNSSWFKNTVGILFILVGLMVVLGIDKDIQAYVLEQGWYDPVSNLEKRLSE